MRRTLRISSDGSSSRLPYFVSCSRSILCPLNPQDLHRDGVAELVGLELQEGLAAGFGPELFALLHALIDLFDRRLDVAGGDRKPGWLGLGSPQT